MYYYWKFLYTYLFQNSELVWTICLLSFGSWFSFVLFFWASVAIHCLEVGLKGISEERNWRGMLSFCQLFYFCFQPKSERIPIPSLRVLVQIFTAKKSHRICILTYLIHWIGRREAWGRTRENSSSSVLFKILHSNLSWGKLILFSLLLFVGQSLFFDLFNQGSWCYMLTVSWSGQVLQLYCTSIPKLLQHHAQLA